MVVLVPGLLALVFGWLAFRSRVSGVYLSIITQALTYALMLAFFRNDMGFGGNNGFTDFKDILGFNLHSPGTRMALFLVTALALGGSYLLCRYIVASRAGRVIAGGARCREPRALHRLSRRIVQAVGVRVLGGAGGHRRRALRAADRHHQPERVLAGELDRDRDLGGDRRPRHALRRGGRRVAGELRQDLFHRGAARACGCTRSARCSCW